MSNPDFKVQLPQEVYQPVSFPVVVQRSLDLVTYPQPIVYPQNWYGLGYFTGSTGFVGPQDLSTVLNASESMKKAEHMFGDHSFTGN